MLGRTNWIWEEAGGRELGLEIHRKTSGKSEGPVVTGSVNGKG